MRKKAQYKFPYCFTLITKSVYLNLVFITKGVVHEIQGSFTPGAKVIIYRLIFQQISKILDETKIGSITPIAPRNLVTTRKSKVNTKMNPSKIHIKINKLAILGDKNLL